MTQARLFFRFLSLVVLASVLFAVSAEARVYLDITSADLKKLTVAIPPIPDRMTTTTNDKGRKMAELIGRALSFHGFIDVLPSTSYSDPQSADWKALGADFLISGTYETAGSGVMIELRLMDIHEGRMAMGKRYRAEWDKERSMLLKFADEVVEHLTGEPGVSNTQIAFISDETGKKEVFVADVLGDNVRQVTQHKWITMSPRFTPDGKKLTYTSFHRDNPNLYITDLSQSKTTKALSYSPGQNLAPSWKPDGKSMIITLGKDGNPDLYLMAPNGNVLQRLTNNEGISTSASWAPDGSRFAFVSDRSGTPQIYVMDIATLQPRRITFEGVENTQPAWSPKGDLIAFTGRTEGAYHLYTISPDGTGAKRLTQSGGDHESSSWSPDGRQIVFSRGRGGSKQICTLFLKGTGVRPLFERKGSQISPNWSPRLDY